MSRYGLRCVPCGAETMLWDGKACQPEMFVEGTEAYAFATEHHICGGMPLVDRLLIGCRIAVINHGGEVLGQCPGRATFTECLRENGHGGICSLAPETAMHGARRSRW